MDDIFKYVENLEGTQLDDGWIVGPKIVRRDNKSEKKYSVCYETKKGVERFFLKVYNLAKFLDGKHDQKDLISQINIMTGQYKYEKSLSEYCLNHYTENVSCVIGSGTISKEYHALIIPIPYLIFDMADGDAHDFLEHVDNLDLYLKFYSLRQVAVGLKQLHNIDVYHQDVKPSNILTFGEQTKLGDLGRSIHRELQCPFIDEKWWGDKTYLPPEIKYGSAPPDLKIKMLLTDLYLLGSLIYFYFFNCTFNGAFYKELPVEFGPERGLSYTEAKAHLVSAFYKVIEHARVEAHGIFNDSRLEDKFISVLTSLCHPDINSRHHPNSIDTPKNISLKYSLDRYVSDLEYLHRLSRYKLNKRCH